MNTLIKQTQSRSKTSHIVFMVQKKKFLPEDTEREWRGVLRVQKYKQENSPSHLPMSTVQRSQSKPKKTDAEIGPDGIHPSTPVQSGPTQRRFMREQGITTNAMLCCKTHVLFSFSFVFVSFSFPFFRDCMVDGTRQVRLGNVFDQSWP